MRRVTSFAVVFVFWLLLTESLAPLDLALGVLICGALSVWADRVLWRGEPEPLAARVWLRLPGYLAYLLGQIVVAALHVAECAFGPRSAIAPVMHTHRAHFTSDTARVAFANSITLTPGTLTVDVDGDTFVIHCLHSSFSDAISAGDLERRVSAAFDR